MNKCERISLSLPGPIRQEVEKRRGASPFSAQIQSDLTLYWKACKMGQKEALKRLTKNERVVIQEAMISTFWDAGLLPIMIRGGISANVADSPEICEAQGVDRGKLVKKLDAMTDFELIGLLDWCKHNRGGD